MKTPSFVALGGLIRPAGQRAGTRVDLPVYSVTKHRGFVNSLEYFNKQVFSKDLSTYKVVRHGEFAYATIHLDEGSIGVAPEECLISPMYTVFSIDRETVDPDYLVRYLKSPRALLDYPTLSRGTAERRKSISFEAIGRLVIPLPPLPEQRRIAAILDQADSLRRSRQDAIDVQGDFLDALFQQMFAASGSRHPIGELGRIVTGKTPVGAGPEMFGGDIPFVTPGDLGTGKGSARYLSDQALRTAPTVGEGSLLVCCIGATVGKMDITAQRVGFNQQINAVEWKPIVLSAYGFFAVRNLKPEIVSRAASTTMPILSKSKFAELTIAVPNLDAQWTFQQHFENHVMLQQHRTQHLALLDELFASLQHRAFTGQL